MTRRLANCRLLRPQPAVTATPRLGMPSRGASLVSVVQTVDFREGDHVTLGDASDASRRRRVFCQREMRSRPVIIVGSSRRRRAEIGHPQRERTFQ